MEPSNDLPPSQATPTTQVELVAQVEPIATSMNVEVPPLPPKGKGKVSKKATSSGN